MNTIWCDTETTGIDPMNSGAFEIAFLFAKDGKVNCERVFHLNPLNDKIFYHEDAGKVHGVSESEIRSFPPAEKIVPNIAEFLHQAIYAFGDGEKLIFAGYNCAFDYKHLTHLFARHGFNLDNYFEKQFCVMAMVKRGVKEKRIPYMKNLKLGTVCKALNVPLENAHTSLADIRATRQVCVHLYKQGVTV